jgi:sulfate permease
MEILIFLIAVFFVLNMGAPSFAGSFSTAVGSKALGRIKSQILFGVFAVLGALVFGGAVAKTLGGDIIPPEFLTNKAVLIIIAAAALSLFTANMMHIPQSTSLSTIAAISGVGLFYQQINVEKIQYLAVCWSASIIISFVLIFFAARYVYPPRKSNFWIYEKLVHHTQRLKVIVNCTSMYKAFAQGSNNVANAVGPLAAAGLIGTRPGLLLMGILFGLGAFVFSGPLKTSSEKIVPLGLLTATVINLVSGTITIIASKLGVPLPTVIVYTVAIFAIGSIKDGVGLTLDNPVTRKTFFTWCINPVITFGVSYGLSWLFLKS